MPHNIRLHQINLIIIKDKKRCEDEQEKKEEMRRHSGERSPYYQTRKKGGKINWRDWTFYAKSYFISRFCLFVVCS